MSDRFEFGRVSTTLEPHPLLPEGHTFGLDEIPVVTEWGGVLPPVEFCRDQLDLLRRIPLQPRLGDGKDLITLASYLPSRITFIEETGCWFFSFMRGESEDDMGKYRKLTIASLGLETARAHRVTIRILMGVDPGEETVEHCCRARPCCNPYHLEVISQAENNARKERAIQNTRKPSLMQHLPIGLSYGQLLVRSSVKEV